MVLGAGVHQVAAGAARRDAITNHMLEARSVIRALGLRSEIFIDDGHIDPALSEEVLPHQKWDLHTGPDDVAIVHYSIASTAFEHIAMRTDLLALHYHNITPARLLQRFAPLIAAECASGRARLADLRSVFKWVAADSQFNLDELQALGFPAGSVLGVMRRALDTRPERPERRSAQSRRALFVGRGMPNKAQHELILALAAMRDAGLRIDLRLVGSWGGAEAYENHCRRLAKELGVAHAVSFLGSVDDATLAREYADADLFLCLSDHEGFCVPLVEAMEAGLPIIAYAGSAVTETAGGAALLLDDKAPSIVAEAAIELLANERLRALLDRGRQEQLEALSVERVGDRVRAFVETISSYPADAAPIAGAESRASRIHT